MPLAYHLAVSVVFGIVLGLFLSNCVLSRAYVVGDSMIPTYEDGDTLWVCKVLTPSRGDRVVVEADSLNKDIIKRVIALPGETIQIIEGRVYINDEYYPEEYINNHELNYSSGLASEPITLGENEYFVMGDNRVISRDSREIGPVSRDDVIGVVIS